MIGLSNLGLRGLTWLLVRRSRPAECDLTSGTCEWHSWRWKFVLLSSWEISAGRTIAWRVEVEAILYTFQIQTPTITQIWSPFDVPLPLSSIINFITYDPGALPCCFSPLILECTTWILVKRLPRLYSARIGYFVLLESTSKLRRRPPWNIPEPYPKRQYFSHACAWCQTVYVAALPSSAFLIWGFETALVCHLPAWQRLMLPRNNLGSL
jgi:hypothetical protein